MIDADLMFNVSTTATAMIYCCYIILCVYYLLKALRANQMYSCVIAKFCTFSFFMCQLYK